MLTADRYTMPPKLPAATGASQRFAAAARSYDREADVQVRVAREVDTLCATVGQVGRVLEVGCGTGLLTALLRRRFAHARIDAIDAAAAMVRRARQRLGTDADVNWLCGNVLKLECHAGCDLVVSSSVLHWLQPLHPALRHLAGMMRAGASLVAGVMVEGTLGELGTVRQRVVPHKPAPIQLPTTAEVLAAGHDAGLTIVGANQVELSSHHAHAAALLAHLHDLGVTGATVRVPRLNRSELRALVREYDREFRDGARGVVATYQVLYVKATKA